jgi:hypothetical protein
MMTMTHAYPLTCKTILGIKNDHFTNAVKLMLRNYFMGNNILLSPEDVIWITQARSYLKQMETSIL